MNNKDLITKIKLFNELFSYYKKIIQNNPSLKNVSCDHTGISRRLGNSLDSILDIDDTHPINEFGFKFIEIYGIITVCKKTIYYPKISDKDEGWRTTPCDEIRRVCVTIPTFVIYSREYKEFDNMTKVLVKEIYRHSLNESISDARDSIKNYNKNISEFEEQQCDISDLLDKSETPDMSRFIVSDGDLDISLESSETSSERSDSLSRYISAMGSMSGHSGINNNSQSHNPMKSFSMKGKAINAHTGSLLNERIVSKAGISDQMTNISDITITNIGVTNPTFNNKMCGIGGDNIVMSASRDMPSLFQDGSCLKFLKNRLK